MHGAKTKIIYLYSYFPHTSSWRGRDNYYFCLTTLYEVTVVYFKVLWCVQKL